MSDVNKCLFRIQNNQGRPNTITRKDLALIMWEFGRKLNVRYEGLCQDHMDFSHEGQTFRLQSAIVGIIQSAVSNLWRKPCRHKEKAAGYFYSFLVRNAVADFFRSQKQDNFAKDLHTMCGRATQTLFMYEKDKKSIFNNWWGGAPWPEKNGERYQDEKRVEKFDGDLKSSFEYDHMTTVLRAEGRPESGERSDQQLITRYALYLLEVRKYKYLRFKNLHPVIREELEGLNYAAFCAGTPDFDVLCDCTPARNFLGATPVPADFDPVVLQLDLRKIVPNRRMRFVLFLRVAGFSCSRIERAMAAMAREHDLGFKPCKLSLIAEIAAKAREELIACDYWHRAALECIYEVLEQEFRDLPVDMTGE